MQVMVDSADILLRTLAAGFLLAAFLYVGEALSRRFLAPSATSIRWAIAILIALFAATICFHLLAALEQFRLLPALLVLGVAGLLVHWFVRPFADFLQDLSNDMIHLAALFLARRKDWRVIPVVVLSCLVFVPVAKTLLIPPLGWDALTYHCVKPAMWVQTGGALTMQAPGGWSYFSLFVGGGEVLTAWVMLPFRSDLLVPFLGALIWLATGFLMFAAGRRLGLSRWLCLMAMFFALFVPAVFRIAGAGYTEPSLVLFSLGAVLAGLCYFAERNPAFLVLGLAMTGLMAGTESEGLPVTGLVMLVLAAGTVFDARYRAVHLKWFLLGCLSAFLVVAPWWVRSYLQTGYPLTPVPVKVFGVTLGVIVPELAWVQKWPNSVSSIGRELAVLRDLFSFSAKSPYLGLFMLLPMFLFPAGIVALWRRNRWMSVLAAAAVAGVLVAFYFPGMEVIRLNWAPSNARLLLLLVPLATLGAAVALGDTPGRSTLFATVLSLLAAFQAFDGLFWGVDGVVMSTLPFVSIALLLLAFLVMRLAVRGRTAAVGVVLFLVPLLALPCLARFRDRTRADVFADEGTMMWHYTLRYWSDAARVADHPARPAVVAVTSAPWQGHDSWLDYAFLGSRFQNTLVYVPISAVGQLRNFDGTEAYRQDASYEAWSYRLGEMNVDYVMSFWPTSLELLWMREHPERFRELSSGEKWGFFAVKGGPGQVPAKGERGKEDLIEAGVRR